MTHTEFQAKVNRLVAKTYNLPQKSRKTGKRRPYKYDEYINKSMTLHMTESQYERLKRDYSLSRFNGNFVAYIRARLGL